MDTDVRIPANYFYLVVNPDGVNVALVPGAICMIFKKVPDTRQTAIRIVRNDQDAANLAVPVAAGEIYCQIVDGAPYIFKFVNEFGYVLGCQTLFGCSDGNLGGFNLGHYSMVYPWYPDFSTQNRE